jgi:hypothetical protein
MRSPEGSNHHGRTCLLIVDLLYGFIFWLFPFLFDRIRTHSTSSEHDYNEWRCFRVTPCPTKCRQVVMRVGDWIRRHFYRSSQTTGDSHLFRPSWQLMQHACMAVGITIATAYDTLGESGLTHSLNEPECVGVFTNAELLPTVLRVLPNTPTIKVVIYDGTPPQTSSRRSRPPHQT